MVIESISMSTVKLKSIYLEGNRIKKMYGNGSLLYQCLIKPYFSLSTNSIEVEQTGETFTFTITCNDRWTITKPENVTLSSVSGYGTTTITGYTTGIFETGTINVTCYNQTLSINVTMQVDWSKKYLTFKITSDGTIKWFGTGITRTIQYSKDNGLTWTSITSSTASTLVSVVAGETVIFKGTNTFYSTSDSIYSCFRGSNCGFEVCGNLMSLVYGDNFTGQTAITESYALSQMFLNCTGLKNAINLILPAMSIPARAYQLMFAGCSSLTTAPELPATAFTGTYNYHQLFASCTSLVNPPSILPATSLTNYCYRNMFYNCTSLTTAPELPAATLPLQCYYRMFYGCTKLNYVKCLATSGINTNSSTQNWLYNVSSTGTFVKKSSATWPSGVGGIPNGWTVTTV